MKSTLPQLDISSYSGQLFWLAVGFIVLYTLTSRYFIPAVSSVIEERAERIRSDLAKAGDFKQEAEALLTDFEATLHQTNEQAKAVVSGARTAQEKEAAAREARNRDETRRAIQDSLSKADALAAASEKELRKASLEAAKAILKIFPVKRAKIVDSDIRA